MTITFHLPLWFAVGLAILLPLLGMAVSALLLVSFLESRRVAKE